MNKFTAIAQSQTTLSPLMTGIKLSTDDLIKKYPDGVTISEFDIVSISDDVFPVIRIMEDNNAFAFGGAVLMRLCEAWVQEYNGDIKACSDDLKAAGGVKVQFSREKTKKGNNITVVRVVG